MSTHKDRHQNPRLAAYLPAEYIDRLRQIARAQRRTLTAQLMLALEQHFAEQGRPLAVSKDVD